MGVVVVDVVDDEALELSLVPDDGAVEEFSSDRADPSLSEGIRYGNPHWCLEDLETLGSEHFVKCVDELAASIANQRPCGGLETVAASEEQVAGGLSRPLAGRGWR